MQRTLSNHTHTVRVLVASTFATLALAGCGEPKSPLSDDSFGAVPTASEMVAAAAAAGMVRTTFPDPDPGIPAYARVGLVLNQVFHDQNWAVIPFYRDPAAVPGTFNLLQSFDFPGPNGPGAFAAPLLINGFYMVERNAPLGTFPKIAVSSGNAVPFWFVPWPQFQSAMADNVITMDELRAMNPLEGTATQFEETLRPREGEHLVVINAKGRLQDNRRFDVHITHVEDVTRSIRIDIR